MPSTPGLADRTAIGARLVLPTRLSRERCVLLVLAIAYGVVLRAVYVHAIVPVFSYMNFRYHPAPLWVECALWMLTCLPVLWLPIQLRRPSHLILWLLYLFVLVPNLFVPSHALNRPYAETLTLAVVLTACFHVVAMVLYLPVMALPRISVRPGEYKLFIVALTVLLNAYILSVFGFHLRPPNLDDVYVTRLAFRAEAVHSGTAYIVPWLSNVLNPLLITIGLYSRRRLLLVLGIVGQLMLFSITGMKTIFFSGVFMVALLYPLKRNGNVFGVRLLAAMTMAVVACGIIDLFLPFPLLSTLFVRRMILAPGLLTGLYFDYYSQHEPAMLAHSFLRSLAGGASVTPPPRLIGQVYFHSPVMAANANIWADGYANFRFLGVLGVSIALLLVLWIFDSVANERSLKVATLSLAMVGLTLCDSALSTTLLTHGWLLAILLVFIMPQDETNPSSGSPASSRIASPRLHRSLVTT